MVSFLKRKWKRPQNQKEENNNFKWTVFNHTKSNTMKNLARKETFIQFGIYIFIITLLIFNIGCSDDNEDITEQVADETADDSTDDDSTADDLTVNNYLMIASGQTNLYNADGDQVASLSEGDAFYGQDANYLKGEAMSFTDNGDGTIIDDNTGLMWQQIPTSEDFSWQDAVDYCESLELAGYDDWRIPSCKELYSISDFGLGWPYLNTTYFTLASGQVTKDEQYWSSDYYVGVTVEGGSNAAFGVNHVTGHIKAYSANASGPVGGKYVRAVRGGDYGVNEYIDNGDGTIIDNATDLMWTQSDNGEGLDWESALAYAESSEEAGYTDWRLPNVKELQGIVDYSYSPSATDASKVGPAIDPIFSCTPIINEGGDDDYGYYWTSTSANFTSGQPYYYAWYVAFGMAVDGNGDDFHGAGGVRFDTKVEGGPLGEGGERYYNYVRLVRDAN